VTNSVWVWCFGQFSGSHIQGRVDIELDGARVMCTRSRALQVATYAEVIAHTASQNRTPKLHSGAQSIARRPVCPVWNVLPRAFAMMPRLEAEIDRGLTPKTARANSTGVWGGRSRIPALPRVIASIKKTKNVFLRRKFAKIPPTNTFYRFNCCCTQHDKVEWGKGCKRSN
jgi:hypothetical protein